MAKRHMRKQDVEKFLKTDTAEVIAAEWNRRTCTLIPKIGERISHVDRGKELISVVEGYCLNFTTEAEKFGDSMRVTTRASFEITLRHSVKQLYGVWVNDVIHSGWNGPSHRDQANRSGL